MSASKYLWVAVTSARSNLAYFGEVVARTIFLGVILYIFLQLWRTTFEQMGEERLGGLTLAQMLWYLAITESIVLSAPAVAVEVDQDVRTGALAVQMIRPLSYPLYRLGTSLGERFVRFAMNALVASAITMLFVGPISITALGLGMFLAALPLAFALDFIVYFTIGLGAFWLENTSGLTLLYSRITMVLGGMLLPLELFPDSLRAVAEFLPFASVIYGPARLFVAPDAAFLGALVAKQALGIVVLGLAGALVNRAARRRVFSNGG
jgi:ABC-2 type transport system permease protein